MATAKILSSKLLARVADSKPVPSGLRVHRYLAWVVKVTQAAQNTESQQEPDRALSPVLSQTILSASFDRPRGREHRSPGETNDREGRV